jgi:hypothetical protein
VRIISPPKEYGFKELDKSVLTPPSGSIPFGKPRSCRAIVSTPTQSLDSFSGIPNNASTAKPEECWSLAASEFALGLSLRSYAAKSRRVK